MIYICYFNVNNIELGEGGEMVSVIIPTYNRKNSIIYAIESVLNQTYTNLELIVVDDGSTDGTQNILEQIKDKRFRYVYQKNSGACVARNRGIDLAQGEYIAFHDSDDTWLPNKLEKQMKIFEKYNVDIVFCKLNYKNGDGVMLVQPSYIHEGFLIPVVNLFGIGTQTLVAKNSVFKNIRFDNELPRFQEFELLYRASKQYSLYCVDEGLVDYSIGSDSISSNPEKLYRTCQLILTKHPELKNDYPIMMEFMAHSLLTSANILKERKDWCYKKYVKFAFSCCKSSKILIKATLVWTGTYSIWRKQKNTSFIMNRRDKREKRCE